nr:DNA-entry nuclease [Liquorilactobacillus mali]
MFKDKVLGFIHKHYFISLFIIAFIVLLLFPHDFLVNIAAISIIAFAVLMIIYIFKRVGKHDNSQHKYKTALIAVLVIFFASFSDGIIKSDTSSNNASSETTAVAHKTSHKKDIAADKIKAAKEAKKARKESLARASSRKAKASSKKAASESRAAAKSESESIAASESASVASSESESESLASSSSIAQSSSIAASVASSQSTASSQSVASSIATSQSVAASSSRAAATSKATVAQTTNNNGGGDDLYTGTSGKIIGNSQSHIYHVPGQAGYHMNSSNAVYFNSEADAQAAGYRKSLR